MKRRHFIQRIALVLATVTGAVAAVSYLRQFFPRLAGERQRISLGDPRLFPVDTYTFLPEHNIYIYRDHEGIKAMSAVCTHLGCILEKSTDGFECPCHGSCYNLDGEVLSGPAPRDLSWYQVGRFPDGKLFVDPGRTVEAGDKFLTT
jgi:cytochrome b6-f complex iron-sulfur subunit